MAAGAYHFENAVEKYKGYTNTSAFLWGADEFISRYDVPQSVHDLLSHAFDAAPGFNHITLLVTQLSAMMSQFEGASIAMRFSAHLPIDLIKQLQEEIDGIKEGAMRWVKEECEKLGLTGVDEALADVKKWLEDLKKRPDKDNVQLDCLRLVATMKKIPLDNFDPDRPVIEHALE
jgi:hypothetical protein